MRRLKAARDVRPLWRISAQHKEAVVSSTSGFVSGRWSRRGVIRLLSGSAMGVAAASLDDDVLAAPFQAGSSSRAWPRGAIIRTVLKDVPPESLNVILFHEHVHIVASHGLQPLNAVVPGKGGLGMPNPTRDATED